MAVFEVASLSSPCPRPPCPGKGLLPSRRPLERHTWRMDRLLEASTLGPGVVATGPGPVGLVLPLAGRGMECGGRLAWSGQTALACKHILLIIR